MSEKIFTKKRIGQIFDIALADGGINANILFLIFAVVGVLPFVRIMPEEVRTYASWFLMAIFTLAFLKLTLVVLVPGLFPKKEEQKEAVRKVITKEQAIDNTFASKEVPIPATPTPRRNSTETSL